MRPWDGTPRGRGPDELTAHPRRSRLGRRGADQRGTGLSGKPPDGYDTATLASDLAALMDALGHQRLALAGHDTGMWIGYALANTMKLAADDVRSVVIPGCGHYCLEEAPQEVLAALTAFLRCVGP